jgi:hypothetical protein
MKPREIALVIGLTAILVAGAFFYNGWFMWNYRRPPTAINYIQQSNGTNATMVQNTVSKQKDKWWSFGVYAGNHNSYGGVVTIYP